LKTSSLSTAPNVSTREKLITAGLYLSKYDLLGVKKLGFDSFIEAFNVIVYALGSKPASIKNYRDEFDPRFPNSRKGWHKLETRDYCLAVFEKYKELDLESFTSLVLSYLGYDSNLGSERSEMEQQADSNSSFAQRLITGLAAEHYFEAIHANLPEFKGYSLENTTRYGCGYDFRLRTAPADDEFLAVEVKGLKGRGGSLTMTPKEHEAAAKLSNRFFSLSFATSASSHHMTYFKIPYQAR